MRRKQPFNYNRALNRLIRLRFEARQRGEGETTPEILELERQVYAYVRSQRQDEAGQADAPEDDR